MNQDDETDQEIGDHKSEDTGASTLSSNLEDDDLDDQLKVLYLGQVRRDKSLHTSGVPLPKKRSPTDTVIACPPCSNSRNVPSAIAPPVLELQKSAVLNKFSKSNRARSGGALMLPNKSSSDHNVPQPKASSDQNVPHHQRLLLRYRNGSWRQSYS